ncbi:type VI secretion system Vgr family protein [Sorangium sp. So ce363]|uniref:type VI secretion system Vgr family protein n=1 Tax=Sorangium sp. So ce363 TaxID=3133304 RepID=UPI003F635E42
MPDMFVVQSSSLPSSAQLVAFHGTEGISKLYRFELYLTMTNDVGHEVDMAAAVGKPVTISLDRSDGGARFLRSGVLESIELINDLAGRCVFRAIMVPRLALLTLSLHSRVFSGKTIPAIIRDVLQKGGVTDCAFQLRGAYGAEEHVCQYRESDYDFIARWMEREGIYYHFEHGEGGETLVLVDDRSAHEPHGDKPVRYYPQSGGADTARDAFRSFTCRHGAVPGSVRLKDYDYTNPAVAVAGQSPVCANGFGEVSLYGARFFSPREGARLARIKAESLAVAGVVYQATGAAGTLIPGFTFELEDHPRAAYNTSYLTTEIEHWSNQAPGVPELRELAPWEEGYRIEAKAIAATAQFRARQVTEWPRIYGTETAIIEGAAVSDYAQIDSHGRYRVKFHFDESDLSGGKASTWVRMLQPHGGGVEGFHFPLRAGVEVMCAFAGGDPDRPSIVGVAPNALTPSPVTAGNSTRNVIQTGGRNRIELEDQAGQERITLSTPHSNTYIRMGAPNSANLELKTGGDFGSTVGGASTSTVLGNRFSFTLGASESVVAGFRLNFTGGYVGNFIAGWATNVIWGRRDTLIKGNESTRVLGNRKTLIAGTRETTIVGKDTTELKADRSVTIRGDSELTVDGKRATEINGHDESEFFEGRETTVHGLNKTKIFGPLESEVTLTEKKSVRGKATADFFAGREVTIHAGGSTTNITGKVVTEIFGNRDTVVKGNSASKVVGKAESEVTRLYKTKIGRRVEVIRSSKIERIGGVAYKICPYEVKKVSDAVDLKAKRLNYNTVFNRIKTDLDLQQAELHLIK